MKEWIDCFDKPPDICDKILVICNEDNEIYIIDYKYNKWGNDDSMIDFIYWMPLPKIPK